MKTRRRYAPVDQKEVEQAVYRLSPAGTQEIAELIGISRQATHRRLRVLDLREKIWSKKAGPTTVWVHPYVMADPDPGRDTEGAREVAHRTGETRYLEDDHAGDLAVADVRHERGDC